MAEIEVEHLGLERRVLSANDERRRYREHGRRHAKCGGHREVHRRELARLRADRLHDADLARLPNEQGRHEIHDEEGAQHHRQQGEGELGVEQRIHLRRVKVFARYRDIHIAHHVPAALDGDTKCEDEGANGRLIERSIREDHAELIERDRRTKLCERGL